MVKDVAIYAVAALAEIAGCFAFWLWLRQGAPAWTAVAGLALLAGFAALLTRVDAAAAGRSYAAYGGIYIAASLAWLKYAEGIRPTTADILGAGVSLAGAVIIMAGGRHLP
jgi:small multidrug resistance family-3 protein